MSTYMHLVSQSGNKSQDDEKESISNMIKSLKKVYSKRNERIRFMCHCKKEAHVIQMLSKNFSTSYEDGSPNSIFMQSFLL